MGVCRVNMLGLYHGPGRPCRLPRARGQLPGPDRHHGPQVSGAPSRPGRLIRLHMHRCCIEVGYVPDDAPLPPTVGRGQQGSGMQATCPEVCGRAVQSGNVRMGMAIVPRSLR